MKGDQHLTAQHSCLALVVQPLTRLRVTGWLQPLGHTLEFVDSAAELLAHPRLAECALVIVSVQDETHLHVCRVLGQRLETTHLPLVAVTENRVWRQAAYEAGAQVVLGRTTTLAEIRVRLQALLARRQAVLQWAERRASAAERDRELIRGVFRRYVAPQLVDHILQSRTGADEISAGKRCQAAVLFADMRGFTRVAEQLTPTQVFVLINEFFGALTAAAFRHEGTVFNMAGDSLMVGFGVPVSQADAGVRALRAARDMLNSFNQLAELWLQRDGVQAGLGVGINEGEVMAGNIGGEQYMNYSLLGDTVNVAARLGQRARAGEVLFSGALKLALDDTAVKQTPLLALPPLTLRGRTHPVDIYCVPIEKRVELPV